MKEKTLTARQRCAGRQDKRNLNVRKAGFKKNFSNTRIRRKSRGR